MRFLLMSFLLFSHLGLATSYDPSHTVWSTWLKKFTQVAGPVTTVNYKQAQTDIALLNTYIASVEDMSKGQYDKLPNNEKLAFLINAYNAFTVKWILQHYPVKSIKDTGGFLSSPWKKKFFKLFGEEQSLDGIEHGIIRKDFQEPRIHFAVVCASKGCPALKGEAYTAAKLDEQLETSARNFLNDKERNYYNAEENRFFLSKIFDWYGEDFKKKMGSVQAFVAPRMASSPSPDKLQDSSLKFLDYDWSLNETK